MRTRRDRPSRLPPSKRFIVQVFACNQNSQCDLEACRVAKKLIRSLLHSQKRGAAEVREITIQIQFLFSTWREDKLIIAVLTPASLFAVIMKRKNEEKISIRMLNNHSRLNSTCAYQTLRALWVFGLFLIMYTTHTARSLENRERRSSHGSQTNPVTHNSLHAWLFHPS